ncbi:MAG: FxsA family protein [Actinomycetales bacterium]|nr:FxsA family protein [Actinomycetales bacterium]
MRFRTRLIVFGYPLVEFLLLWLIASVVGWGWALIGILLSIPIGIAVMRNASAGARVVLQESDPERALEQVGSGAGLFLAGLCFLVPGYGSDLVGLVLLVPSTRRWVVRRMTRGFDSFAWVDRMPGFPSSGTVVQGTVVTVEDSNFPDIPDIPDIPRLPDNSEDRNSRNDDPQPPRGTGT